MICWSGHHNNDWNQPVHKIEELVGKVCGTVINDGSELIFNLMSGEKYKFYHKQDCCESVYIEDVIGDLNDLVGTPILTAEEVSSEGEPGKSYSSGDYTYEDDSFTWTFYKFSTIKGSVTVRWYGSSNGYYSESVDFAKAYNID